MSRPRWFVQLIKKLFPERFLFARVTNLPVVDRVVDYCFFHGDEVIYLPKDQTIQINEHITQTADMVLPSRVVEHFIESANYHWIMDFCICRSSNHCQDYPLEYGCIFLGEAVLKINPEFGRLVSKEQALQHARHCREMGLVHMVGRNKLDSIWLGANPADKLMTICNCCPCCCLWKVLPYITPILGDKVSKMPGVSVTVNELCTGCGTCTDDICFAEAIEMVDGYARINGDCRGCGRCVEVCPNQAIDLTIDEGAFVQQTIDRLSPLVDVS